MQNALRPAAGHSALDFAMETFQKTIFSPPGFFYENESASVPLETRRTNYNASHSKLTVTTPGVQIPPQNAMEKEGPVFVQRLV